MKIVAGARNDGRKPFDFEVTDRKTGEKFSHSKTGISLTTQIHTLSTLKTLCGMYQGKTRT